jgi:hemin uptake protein HemP
MAIPVHTKPTKSNVAWPTPPSNAITSDSNRGQTRHHDRLPYRRVSDKPTDPLLGSKKRVIIAHDGRSFGAPPLT